MDRKKIDMIVSAVVPLPVENIDTDQIIPARFLKATSREGFGDNLFRDWRFDAGNNPKPGFVLNNSAYASKILVAGKNFGCGSSREHAAWAIKDYGFDVVVSSFFADIFRNNALNNFLLPVQVSEDYLQKILVLAAENPQMLLRIDITTQTIIIVETGETEQFGISAYKKNCVLNGFDDIDYLLSIKRDIEVFETTHK